MFRLLCGNSCKREVSCTIEVACQFRKLMPLVANGINSVTLPPYMAHVDVDTLIEYVDQYDKTDTLVVNYPVMILKLAYELELVRDNMLEMLVIHAIDHMTSYKEFKNILSVVSRIEHERECNTFELYDKAVCLALSGEWSDEVLSVKHRDQLVRHVMKYAEAEDIVNHCDTLIRELTVMSSKTEPKAAVTA